MRFKGNCPRCESILEVEVTHENESYLNTCVTVAESFLSVCQAHGPFYENDIEYTSHNRDEIIVQCPICNTIVNAQKITHDDL